MNIVPAKVAGVEEVVMATPPGRDGKVTANTLVAAKEAGADVIYKAGGAQAVAALALGTESVPKVDKIVGPGNVPERTPPLFRWASPSGPAQRRPARL